MGTPKKQILLNAFNMNCVGHINHGLWAHPRDRSGEYNTLGYWTGPVSYTHLTLPTTPYV